MKAELLARAWGGKDKTGGGPEPTTSRSLLPSERGAFFWAEPVLVRDYGAIGPPSRLRLTFIEVSAMPAEARFVVIPVLRAV